MLAYAISPTRGSEYSVAWNYVTHMSKYHKLTVIYGASGDNMGDTAEMEAYIQKNASTNIRFVAVKPDKWANLLNWPNRHGIFVYTFYYAYKRWHWLVYQKVLEILDKEHFDLIHYVGMIGYREPGYLWNLGLPYIWGPVSGANNAPPQLMKHMPLMGKAKLTFRSIANTLQFYTNRRLRKALISTHILLTATSENQLKFKKIHHKASICIPENGITEELKLNRGKFLHPRKYRIISIGRLDANKSVSTFLEALTLVTHRNLLHVDIVGDGPLKSKLQQYAVQQDLNSIITWYGQLPRTEAVKIFNSAHLHVITSVSEGNPTTIWEAMSYGVPTISFDHCGMHDTICDRCGIRVPVYKRYEDCVSALAKEIDSLLEHPERFHQLAEGTIECAKKFMWTEREQLFNDLYNKLLSEVK